jgi:hypothetical protein
MIGLRDRSGLHAVQAEVTKTKLSMSLLALAA